MLFDNEKIKSGDSITCCIGKEKIKDAKLYIDSHANAIINGHDYYICHNDSRFSGSHSPNKLGYQYSWIFYRENDKSGVNNIKKVKINIFDNIIKKSFNMDIKNV
jgi:hypothetical protein